MPQVHNQDDKWTVLDALVLHTVHCVLFQEPASKSLQDKLKQQVEANVTSRPEALPALLLTPSKCEKNGDEASVQYAAYCKRVLGCQLWTDDQLQQEKTALKRYLRQQSQQQLQQQEQVSTELYCAFEAYALLKLFLLERTAVNKANFTSSLQQQKDSDRVRLLLLLHVQLELYNKYFEHAKQRKVSLLLHGTPLVSY